MSRDRALPRMVIRHRRPLVPVALALAVIVLLAAAAALMVHQSSQAEGWRDRFEAYVAAQTQAEARISVVFESGALVCKVPPEKEPLAPAVHGACQALANELARLEKPAVVGRK